MGRPSFSDQRCLIVPGLNNSGPRHWQTRWEQTRDDCDRVDFGAWANPHRNHWVTKLDHEIEQQDGPVILVAHSLGCLAVAWWAALTDPERQIRVAGALLVAPPDVERIDAKPVIQRFAPAPRTLFRFPALVVASSDDPYAAIERSRIFARRWGAEFHDAGPLGHINADSFLGDWREGQALLDRLLRQPARHRENGHFPNGTERSHPRLRGH